MEFLPWLHQLSQDAYRLGCRNRFQSDALSIWVRIWAEGVEPSVLGVIHWATIDPERFNDLRETESASQMAA